MSIVQAAENRPRTTLNSMRKLFDDLKPPANTVWYGNWWVDTQTNERVVFVVCRNNYYVPMDRCHTVKEQERWIRQVENKTWGYDAIDGLEEALDVGMRKQAALEEKKP